MTLGRADDAEHCSPSDWSACIAMHLSGPSLRPEQGSTRQNAVDHREIHHF